MSRVKRVMAWHRLQHHNYLGTYLEKLLDLEKSEHYWLRFALRILFVLCTHAQATVEGEK